MLKYYDNQIDVINRNYLSVDFSELFVYMYNRGNIRFDYKIIDYIFGENERSFEYILLPPALIELQMHYETLIKRSEKLKKMNANQKLSISNLLNDIQNIEKNEGKGVNQVLTEYQSSIPYFLRYDGPLALGTNFGSVTILENGFERIKGLFKRNIVKQPIELDIFAGANFANYNEKVYDEVLNKLNNHRFSFSNLNNKIDANHAALVYTLNTEYLPDSQLINIFTGSPIPLKIFENDSHLTSVHKKGEIFSIAKCPVYVATRLFCENELKYDLDKITTLASADEMLGDLAQDNLADIRKLIRMDMSKSNNSLKVRDKVKKILYFYNLFYEEAKFNKYLDESLKIGKSHKMISTITLALSKKNDDDIINTLRNLSTEMDVFEDEDKFIKQLGKSQEKLYDNSKWIYDHLCQKLGDFDLSLLPYPMREVYKCLQEAPKDPKEIEDELEKDSNNGGH